MIPTLQIGDVIVVDEQPRDFTPIRIGEVVIFHGPAADVVCGSPQSILVKRVVGLPGETIQSKGNTVYLNGKPLAEPWLPAGTQLGRAIVKQIVPPGRYYMLGDNSSISCDSRLLGDNFGIERHWQGHPRVLVGKREGVQGDPIVRVRDTLGVRELAPLLFEGR